MSRIDHITDLHFGRACPHKVEALLRQLNQDKPDLIAISGDLTQRARRREFEAAQAFLAALPAPYLVVPGNHDMPLWRPLARFTRPWQAWRRYIGSEQIPCVRAEDFVAVGINTARRWGAWLDWSHGRIARSQLQEVERILSQTRSDALRILVAHHPFLLDGAASSHGLVGRAEKSLARLIAAQVDLILGGHLHRAYSGVSQSGQRTGPVVAQAATAVSNRLKGERNGYNRIHIAPGCLDIETLQWRDSAFVIRQRHRYRKSANAWVYVSG